ncbi:phosphoglycolate phosphatase [Pokkaliibacter sp. CJK22405]|uniref:phosphoglycolate phosphatase n=1 Tax=Pokkaliibacter sp. CJK22405 TaxID=3384615 RepID=UPI00398551A6
MSQLIDEVCGQTCQGVLFDLDGTLVDSVPDLAAALDEMLTALGKPPAGIEGARHWVGNGATLLIKRALTHEMYPTDDHPALLQHLSDAEGLFASAYERLNGQNACLYPGVSQALQQLQDQGLKLAVVTNKPERYVPALLEHLGIRQYFSVIIGGDTLPQRKPDPAQLLLAVERLQVPKAACVMVGDSRHDIEAARNAAMAAIGVPYGYNHGEPITTASPDRVVEQLTELTA